MTEVQREGRTEKMRETTGEVKSKRYPKVLARISAISKTTAVQINHLTEAEAKGLRRQRSPGDPRYEMPPRTASRALRSRVAVFGCHVHQSPHLWMQNLINCQMPIKSNAKSHQMPTLLMLPLLSSSNVLMRAGLTKAWKN